MNIKDLFANIVSTIFAPKASVVVAASVAYIVAKAIVTATPNKVDDEILDRVHKMSLNMIESGEKAEINCKKAD